MKNILVIGIGGAGAFLAPFIKEQFNCSLLLVNTDSVALKKCNSERKLLIGASVCNGYPAVTPERGALAAQESRSELEQELTGVNAVIIAAGLGGGTGSGATPAIVSFARSCGLDVVVAAILPFEFETKSRVVAVDALTELQSEKVHIIIFDNADTLNKHGNHQRSLLEVFEESAQKIADEVSNVFAS